MVRFLSGSTQDSSMVAEVLSSLAGSCWALRKASCSSVDSTGSGSSLKNCFTRPATSQGSAFDRHSSPASNFAWTSKTNSVVLDLSQGQGPLMNARSTSAITHPERFQTNDRAGFSEQALCVDMCQQFHTCVDQKAKKGK